MSSEVEPAKQLLPYLQRADELQKHEPLVAYYCRLFAMEKGLKIPAKERTKTTNSLLISLMKQLEKDKKTVKISPDDSLYLEGFASNVFAKADKQDRAGRADLNTAKTFYAASIFFEILHQFGELQADIEQKQKYALWKAADIRKALKEGRKPEPGPPGGEEDLSMPYSTETTSNDVVQSESFSVSHLSRRESFSTGLPDPETSTQRPPQHFENIPRSHERTQSPPSAYPGSDFHPSDLRQSSLSSRHDDSSYQQSYHPPTQPTEQHLPPTFPHDTRPRTYSHEVQSPIQPEPKMQPPNQPHEPNLSNYPHEITPPNFYSNFQTYPSFSESSLPVASGHYSPYYQDPNTSYLQQPPTQSYTAPDQYGAVGMNGSHAGQAPNSTFSSDASHAGYIAPQSAANIPSYTYDSSYQPPVEKIAEAHKAARFAVGALAFDDVPVAVEFLRKSLELLTNPKAESH